MEVLVNPLQYNNCKDCKYIQSLQLLYPFDELTPLSLYNNILCHFVMVFDIKSILSNISIARPASLWFPLS